MHNPSLRYFLKSFNSLFTEKLIKLIIQHFKSTRISIQFFTYSLACYKCREPIHRCYSKLLQGCLQNPLQIFVMFICVIRQWYLIYVASASMNIYMWSLVHWVMYPWWVFVKCNLYIRNVLVQIRSIAFSFNLFHILSFQSILYRCTRCRICLLLKASRCPIDIVVFILVPLFLLESCLSGNLLVYIKERIH